MRKEEAYTGKSVTRSSAGSPIQIDEYIYGEKVKTTFLVFGQKYIVFNYTAKGIVGDVEIFNPFSGKLELKYTYNNGKIRI